jgi:hypothetical protein
MLLFAAGCLLHAQKVQQGAPFEQREDEETVFGGASDKGICLITTRTLSEENTDLTLELFTPNMRPVGEFELGKDMDGTLSLADVQVLDNRIYLFVLRQPAAESRFELHLFKYDFHGMSSGSPKLIFDYPAGKVNLKAFVAGTRIQLNTDSTLFLVQFPKSMPKADGSRAYVMHLLGRDGYVSWSDTLVVQHEAGTDAAVKPTVVDAAGNVYVTAPRYPDPAQKQRLVRSIYRFDAEAIRWKRVDLNLGELSLVPVQFDFNQSGNLSFVGCFAYGPSPKTQHVIYWELTPQDLAVQREHYSMLEALFPANVNERTLLPFYLKDFTPMPNGGYLLQAEQRSSRVTNNLTGQKTQYADNVLVAQMDTSGAVVWSTLIGKRQTSAEYDGLLTGYSALFLDNQLHLIFNDPPGNASQAGYSASAKTMHGPLDSGIALLSLDLASHELKKKILVELGEGTHLALNQGISHNSDNEWIFLARNSLSYRLMSLKF